MDLLRGLNLNDRSPGRSGELFVQSELPGCGHRCPILAALMPGTSAHRDGDSLASDPQLHHSQTKEVTNLPVLPTQTPASSPRFLLLFKKFFLISLYSQSWVTITTIYF